MKDIPSEVALELFLNAIEQSREEKIFEQWVAQLPFMSARILEYMSFEDYRDKITLKNIDTRSTAEIIAEITAIHSKNEVQNG